LRRTARVLVRKPLRKTSRASRAQGVGFASPKIGSAGIEAIVSALRQNRRDRSAFPPQRRGVSPMLGAPNRPTFE
jgi:hypothetical protein